MWKHVYFFAWSSPGLAPLGAAHRGLGGLIRAIHEDLPGVTRPDEEMTTTRSPCGKRRSAVLTLQMLNSIHRRRLVCRCGLLPGDGTTLEVDDEGDTFFASVDGEGGEGGGVYRA